MMTRRLWFAGGREKGRLDRPRERQERHRHGGKQSLWERVPQRPPGSGQGECLSGTGEDW
jgi:hypothetical protein